MAARKSRSIDGAASFRPLPAACAPPSPIHRLGANHLLSMLSDDVRVRLLERCQRMAMKSGEVLYEADGPILHVYFPLSGMVSMVISSQEGGTIEVGVVGNEGMLGAAAVTGSNTSHPKALIQISGELLRMSVKDFRKECKANSTLADMAQRFTQSLLTQVSQSVMCNRLHPMEERICRWLLMAHDRAGADEIDLTQEFISQMLGIRRPSVTVAAGMLQKAGYIAYSRGNVTVLDRAGLEETACECYRVVRRETEALLRAR